MKGNDECMFKFESDVQCGDGKYAVTVLHFYAFLYILFVIMFIYCIFANNAAMVDLVELIIQ